jgi:phosphoesterase RecJ-like protein
MRAEEVQRAAEVLREKGSFFLATHVRPDGDGLGAMLALAAVLRQMGKRVVVHAPEPAPRLYRFLPGIERLTSNIGAEGCEVAVVVDCGSLGRLGPMAEWVSRHPLVINIDHHQTNSGFGHLRLVDAGACAAAEIVRRLIAELPWPLNPEVALNLYVAVVSDTGGFQNANTDRRAFELAAELVGPGVSPHDVARRLFDDYSLARLKLLGLALSRLESLDGGRLALVSVTRRMLDEAGADLEESAGLINQLSGVAGVKVAALLAETEGEGVEVSLRSRDGVNVADIAEGFGGGGHPNAAGFAQEGRLPEVKRRLVAALEPALDASPAEGS